MKKIDFGYAVVPLKKNYNFYILFVGAIALVEVVLSASSLIFYDITNIESFSYFIGYVYLGILSIALFSALLILKKYFFEHNKALVIVARLYAIAIMIWSCHISSLDVMNGNYPIVFLTVMLVIATLNLLDYYSFITISVVETIIILIFNTIYNSFDSGFYINIIVLIGSSILVCIRDNRLCRENYLNSNKLRTMSYMDSLSGIGNRRAFDEMISLSINERNGFYVALGDIDSFKKLNDTYGHVFGDECIQLVGEKLKGFFGDRAFRYGGDEFSVVWSGSFDELRSRLAELTKGIKHGDVTMYMSFGIAKYEYGMTDDEIVHEADILLYRSKQKHGAITYNA